MLLLHRYLLKNLVIAAVLVTVTLTAAVWLTQSLRLLELTIDGGAPFSLFLNLMVLTLPGLLALTLPITVLIVILFIYNKFTVDRELLILRSSGLSVWSVAVPALYLAIGTACLVFILNAWLAPHTTRQMKQMRHLIQSEYSSLFLKEGVFNTITDGVTVYVHERVRTGELKGLFIHDNRVPDKPVTIIAKKGLLQGSSRGPRVTVFEGIQQEFNPETGYASRLAFDKYSFDIGLFDKNIGIRWREAGERTLGELFNPSLDNPDDRYNVKRFVAEAHTRIASPFLVLSFALIALACLFSGQFSRRGQAGRLVLAAVLSLTAEGLHLGLSNLARTHNSAIFALYFFAIFPAICSIFVLQLSNTRLGSKS